MVLILFGFESFGSLVEPVVQNIILIHRFMLEGYMLVILVSISSRTLDFCHLFSLMLSQNNLISCHKSKLINVS